MGLPFPLNRTYSTFVLYFKWLLMAAPILSHPAVTRRKIGSKAYVLCMLSWRHALTVAMLSMQEVPRRFATSAQRRRPSSQRHEEVWSSSLQYDKLHWLDVPERVYFKLGLMTYRCLHGQAPRYLAKHITQPLKSHLDIDYVSPTDTGSLYHAVDSIRTAVGFFRSDNLKLTARWTQWDPR